MNETLLAIQATCLKALQVLSPHTGEPIGYADSFTGDPTVYGFYADGRESWTSKERARDARAQQSARDKARGRIEQRAAQRENTTRREAERREQEQRGGQMGHDTHFGRNDDEAGGPPPYLQRLIPRPTSDSLAPIYNPATGEYEDPPAAYDDDPHWGETGHEDMMRKYPHLIPPPGGWTKPLPNPALVGDPGWVDPQRNGGLRPEGYEMGYASDGGPTDQSHWMSHGNGPAGFGGAAEYAHEGYPGPQFPPDLASAPEEHHQAAISWLSGLPLKELSHRRNLHQQQLPRTNNPMDESNWHVMEQHLAAAMDRQNFPNDQYAAYGPQPSSHMDMSSHKAREILHDGTVHGHPLTEKQRGLFGVIAGYTHNSAYADVVARGDTREHSFGVPLSPSMVGHETHRRTIGGLDPRAHIVNQPRRSGTLTDEAQRRLVAAFNPSGSYSAYGHTEPNRFNPALGYQERPDDGDARGGNPQSMYADSKRWTNEDERAYLREKRLADEKRRGKAMSSAHGDPFKPTVTKEGYQGRADKYSEYAEHGHAEHSQILHGTPRAPFERPGFLPTMIRNPQTGMGSFHTGGTNDRIVGTPHPSVKHPHQHIPMGFYDDGSMYGDRADLENEFLRGLNRQGRRIPDNAEALVGSEEASREEGRRWLDETAARRAAAGPGPVDPNNYGPYDQSPMHGPGSWNDPHNHLLGDIGDTGAYDEYSPLGHTNTPDGEEYDQWLANGGMGNYAQYDDEHYTPEETAAHNKWIDAQLRQRMNRTVGQAIRGHEARSQQEMNDFRMQKALHEREQARQQSETPTDPNDTRSYFGYAAYNEGEMDYGASCASMLDKLHSIKPVMYEPEIGDTPDRDYWNHKPTYGG